MEVSDLDSARLIKQAARLYAQFKNVEYIINRDAAAGVRTILDNLTATGSDVSVLVPPGTRDPQEVFIDLTIMCVRQRIKANLEPLRPKASVQVAQAQLSDVDLAAG